MPALSQSRRRNDSSTSLRVAITARTGAQHAAFLRRKLALAHRHLKSPLAELSVALVGDRQMSDLHERFMSISGPTDVLTFPLELNTRGLATSGEIVICVPEARRRAPEHGNSLSHELLLYAVHGLLHLCGYDDRTARDFQIMHRTEDDLLCRLGAGPVFAPLPFSPTGRRSGPDIRGSTSGRLRQAQSHGGQTNSAGGDKICRNASPRRNVN